MSDETKAPAVIGLSRLDYPAVALTEHGFIGAAPYHMTKDEFFAAIRAIVREEVAAVSASTRLFEDEGDLESEIGK